MTKPEDSPAPAGVRSLSTATKVLKMLDFVAENPNPMRLSEICAARKLGRATAYQQLKTLADAGWIEQRDDGRYQLSLHVVSVASMALKQMNISERVLITLEALVEQTHETASITAIEGGLPTIIQRIEADRPIVARQNIGTKLDLLTSGSGKVHIIFGDPRIAQQVDGSPIDLLPAEEVTRIRTDRIAFSEPGSGLLAAATPVLDSAGRCIAALSIVGLENRNEIMNSGAHLIAAAEDLSRVLGS